MPKKEKTTAELIDNPFQLDNWVNANEDGTYTIDGEMFKGRKIIIANADTGVDEEIDPLDIAFDDLDDSEETDFEVEKEEDEEDETEEDDVEDKDQKDVEDDDEKKKDEEVEESCKMKECGSKATLEENIEYDIDAEIAALTDKIESLETEKEIALKSGDRDAYLEITEEIAELMEELNEITSTDDQLDYSEMTD